jgi:hypothetical protein
MITVEQRRRGDDGVWSDAGAGALKSDAQLVFVFGGTVKVSDPGLYDGLKKMYPQSHILMCSTAGEILDTTVSDKSLVLSAVHFEKSSLQFSQINIEKGEESYAAGLELATKLPAENLVHAMVFSDGLRVNGTSLVKGLAEKLPAGVSVTGGLVGDGSDFKHTYVGLDEPPREGKIVLIGFYGQSLKVGYGSMGGWDPFGPERVVTKAKNNVLFELDEKPALALYKEYLGELASGLPSTGLLFPLNIRLPEDSDKKNEVVRTLLAINEQDQSMTFAGDIPQGALAKLMKANFERLVDGASTAAGLSSGIMGLNKTELAILISCIGRKLVLKERIEEETEAVRSVLGKQAMMTGFYSYGEICPTAPTEKQCRLHNQTMTITTFRED